MDGVVRIVPARETPKRRRSWNEKINSCHFDLVSIFLRVSLLLFCDEAFDAFLVALSSIEDGEVTADRVVKELENGDGAEEPVWNISNFRHSCWSGLFELDCVKSLGEAFALHVPIVVAQK